MADLENSPPRTVTARPVRQALAWRQATLADTIAETDTARTLIFDIQDWDGHLAGQHLDVRLTAPDGYQATRSYSLSSGPTEVPQITVERVAEGEVSPYLVDVIEPGDVIEIRGPIGGYFVWEPTSGNPLLIGGGSGIAPLRSIWRAQAGTRATVVYSAQTAERILFRDELAAGTEVDTRIHLTRATHPDHESGRIEADDLQRVIESAAPDVAYVCGPTAFVEDVARHLVNLDVDPRTIRTERFG